MWFLSGLPFTPQQLWGCELLGDETMNQVAIEEGSQPYSETTRGGGSRWQSLTPPLLWEDRMKSASSLSPSFSLSHPRAVISGPRSPGVQGRGSRSPRSPLWTEVQRMFFPTGSCPSNPDRKRLWGGNGEGPLNALIVKGIEVGLGKRKRPGQ